MYKLINWLANILNNLLIVHSDRDLYGKAQNKEINGLTKKEFDQKQEKQIAEYGARGIGSVRCSFNPPKPSIPKK